MKVKNQKKAFIKYDDQEDSEEIEEIARQTWQKRNELEKQKSEFGRQTWQKRASNELEYQNSENIMAKQIHKSHFKKPEAPNTVKVAQVNA